DVLDVMLGTATYPDNMGQIRTMSDFVTFLLHLGYLTMGKGNSVQIPNTKVREMWTTFQEIAVHGSTDMMAFDIEREHLENALYKGDVRELRTALIKIKDEWMNTAHSYDEHVFADIICSAVRIRLGGQHVAIKESRDNSTDRDPKFESEKESGKDKPDLAIVIGRGCYNRAEDLLVLVKFKHIDKAVKEVPKEKAKTGAKKGAKKGAKHKSKKEQVKSNEPLK
ncbi:hypothetical protein LPJ61_007059, partial [Coemansia biformis]